MKLSAEQLKALLSQPLPGRVSHLKLAPEARRADLQAELQAPTDAKKSAVMILLFNENDKLNIVYIRRSLYVGIHSGQIAFPGGRFEDEDMDTVVTAFREIEEEIGLVKSEIELVGQLSDIYVPPSNFLISVYVGFLNQKPFYKPDFREVAEVIELEFEELLKPDAITEKTFYVPSSDKSFTAPCYQTSKCDIWGASAMVTSELVEIIGAEFQN